MVPLEVSADVAEDRERWDRFCSDEASGWFWHTTAWREYTLSYGSELGSRSRAFGVMDQDQLVAAMPLMVEDRPEDGRETEISFGGGACWAPALASDLDAKAHGAILARVLEEIDDVATAEGARRATLQLSPLVNSFEEVALPFLAATTEAGWVDTSLTTRAIDLTQSEEQLFRSMRKGHRSDVNRADRLLTVRVHSGASADEDAFGAYRALHKKAAGRETRPKATFDLMRSWVADGRALLLCAERDGAIIGCAYVIVFGEGAYYASAANDPDAASGPVGHILQWEAIRWLKANGYRRYELGVEHRGALPHDSASSKELGIARFKRGFGGISVPLLVRERYYSPDFYRAVSSERASRYGAREER